MTKVNQGSKFDYTTIKTFDDACAKLGINPESLPVVENLPDEFKKPVVAGYKLMVIFKAINDVWTPDWSDSDQYKYYPWFRVLPSGSGFSDSAFFCANARTVVGSRLCTSSSEKSMYIARTFEQEYKDYFLIEQ
jgi:hypothetical protein